MTSVRWKPRLAAAMRDPRGALWKARRRYMHWMFLDLPGASGTTVLLAGSARSGTTWLAAVINYDNSHRYMFDPFRPDRLDETRICASPQYVRPDDERPA